MERVSPPGSREKMFSLEQGEIIADLSRKSVIVIKPTYGTMKHTASFCCALLPPKNHTPTCLVSLEDFLMKLFNLALVHGDLLVLS